VHPVTLLLPLLVLLPLAAAPLPALLWRATGLRPAPAALALALAVLAVALALLPAAFAGEPVAVAWPWLRPLGVGLALRADRVGVGLAVTVAAAAALAIGAAPEGARAAARWAGGTLALAGATLGAALADDLALLWGWLEVGGLLSAWLIGAGRRTARRPRGALLAFAGLEAGSLALFAAALLLADLNGSFGLGDALRADAALQAQPLYWPIVALSVAAAGTRLAPLALPGTGRDLWLVRGAGMAAAALLVLRLAPVLGASQPGPALLVATVTGALCWVAGRVRRGGAAVPAGPTLVDDVALAARLVWRPLTAPSLPLSLAALGAGTLFALALALNGVHAGAWPGPAARAWPLLAGSGWLLLAVAAAAMPGRRRRVAQLLGAAAVAALLLLAVAAPPALAAAELAAGLPALWLVTRARPLPAWRTLAALGACLAVAAALAPLIGWPPRVPPAAAAGADARGAGLIVLAALALPLVAAAVLAALRDAPPRLRLSVAALALAANLALAAGLFALADQGQALGLALGAWPAPFGLHLLLDRLAAEMLLVAALLAMLAFGHGLARPAADRGRDGLALGQLQLFGVAGCVLAADLLELVLFFELLLLALNAQLAPRDDAGSAAAHVATVGAAGSGLLLLAAGCIDAALGTLGYAPLALSAPAVASGDSPLLAIGAHLLLVVLALRAAALPLGLWLARAFEVAPAAAAATLVLLAEVGLYALLRLDVLVFPCFGAGPCGPSGLVLPFGLATLAGGGIGALAAGGRRELVAPLQLVAVGTLLVGVGGLREAGIAGAVYALAPTALAAAAIAFAFAGDGAVRAPRLVAAGALVAALGLPPFPGWIGRIAILGAATADALAVWTLVLVTALLAALGAARAAAARPPAAAPAARSWAAAGVALLLLVALTAASGPALEFAARTARQLFDRQAYVAAFAAAGGDANR